MFLRIAVISVFLWVVVCPQIVRAESYEDCILDHMKGVSDRLAAANVREACAVKAIPKMCKQDYRTGFLDRYQRPASDRHSPNDDWIYQAFGSQSDSEYAKFEACMKKCEGAGFWDRTFGSCSGG